jgi:ribosomal protein S18 acetylase RimI-like enzyme
MKTENFKKTKMTDEIAQQISLWKYEGDYAIYNLPSYDEMKEKNYGMLNKEKANNYICYLNEEEVAAYSSMKEMENKRVFIGIGLKPEYCGKGLGNYFLSDSLNEIKKRYPDCIIYLEVRSWNQRAIKAYEKIGFTMINKVIKPDRFGNECEFIEMELTDN